MLTGLAGGNSCPTLTHAFGFARGSEQKGCYRTAAERECGAFFHAGGGGAGAGFLAKYSTPIHPKVFMRPQGIKKPNTGHNRTMG